MKMLENNNKKYLKTLSDSCLKANKGRNTIAIFAITLTAILFMRSEEHTSELQSPS